MEDFFTFRRMVTPILIRIMFILGVGSSVIGGFVVITRGGTEAIIGLVTVLFGILFLRVFAEIFIVVFQINETLTDIRENTRLERNGHGATAPRVRLTPPSRIAQRAAFSPSLTPTS